MGFCVCADQSGFNSVVSHMKDDMCLLYHLLSVFICTFVRKSEEEILQKPFQKGRHSQVAHRSSHSNEVDR